LPTLKALFNKEPAVKQALSGLLAVARSRYGGKLFLAFTPEPTPRMVFTTHLSGMTIRANPGGL
jgi:hypothetical protein